MLVLTHAPTNEPIDARLDVSRGDAPPCFLVAAIVDERVDVRLEIGQRVKQPASRQTGLLSKNE